MPRYYKVEHFVQQWGVYRFTYEIWDRKFHEIIGESRNSQHADSIVAALNLACQR